MDRDEDFAAFMRLHWRPFVASLTALGCGVHEAEDVAQATFLRLYSSWSKVSDAHDPVAYAYRSLLNTWAKSRRRHWWNERPSAELPERARSDDVEGVSDRVALLRAVEGLSPDQRTVLVLRFVADLSGQQVADLLGIAVGTVKSRTARALAAIDRSLIEEET